VYSIPCIINNFNRVTTTKKLVEDLQRLGYTNVIILDNASTYPPLLEWYSTNPCTIKYLGKNCQSYAVYDCGVLDEFKNLPWVVYTDSDLELNPNTPNNFIEILIEKAEKYGYTKAGLSIKIDDLPDTKFANEYKEWEKKYWETPLEENVFDAQVDTTFCIIKPQLRFDYKAIRVAGDMTCSHRPWYVDFNNLDQEELYYIEQSSEYSTYKRYYYTNKTK
jgi:hypothetical protein